MSEMKALAAEWDAAHAELDGIFPGYVAFYASKGKRPPWSTILSGKTPPPVKMADATRVADLAKILADADHRALQIISLPVAERGKSRARTTSKDAGFQADVDAANGFVELLVHPSLLPQKDVSTETKTISEGGYYHPTHKHIKINDQIPASKERAGIIAHELMHEIEDRVGEVLARSVAYLVKRGATGPDVTTQIPGVGACRILEDEWKKKGGRAYTGRVYENATHTWASEILTTGVQRMIDNSPLEFFRNDPDHFRYVISTLRKAVP